MSLHFIGLSAFAYCRGLKKTFLQLTFVSTDKSFDHISISLFISKSRFWPVLSTAKFSSLALRTALRVSHTTASTHSCTDSAASQTAFVSSTACSSMLCNKPSIPTLMNTTTDRLDSAIELTPHSDLPNFASVLLHHARTKRPDTWSAAESAQFNQTHPLQPDFVQPQLRSSSSQSVLRLSVFASTSVLSKRISLYLHHQTRASHWLWTFGFMSKFTFALFFKTVVFFVLALLTWVYYRAYTSICFIVSIKEDFCADHLSTEGLNSHCFALYRPTFCEALGSDLADRLIFRAWLVTL